MSRYPTGVTLVTRFASGKALGMTVNSFASVSLDPPLILWSIARETERYDLFSNTQRFGVSVLAHDQAGLAAACAQSPVLDEIGAGWSGDVAPMIDGAVAQFVCRTSAIHNGGDHDVIIGEVVEMSQAREAPALTFYRGEYGRIG